MFKRNYRRGHFQRRLSLESLEDRHVLAAVTVDIANDVVDSAPAIDIPTLISNPGPDGRISLREAIMAANLTDDGTIDEISFAPSIVGDNATITLTHSDGELLVTDDLTITGPGKGLDDPEIYDLTISGNHSSRIFNISGTSVEMSGVRLSEGNDGVRGGAIFSDYSNLKIIDCEISGNHAEHERGGGIAINAADNEIEIRNSIISANTTGFHSVGGGLAISASGSSQVLIQSTTISTNTAGSGDYYDDSSAGGIRAGISEGSYFTLDRCTVSGNTSYGQGGGMAISNYGDAQILNSTISGNRSVASGGGLFVWDHGDGVTRISHTSIAFNQIGFQSSALFSSPTVTGGGLWVYGNPYTGKTPTVLEHTIVANNLDLIDIDPDPGNHDANTPDVHIEAGPRYFDGQPTVQQRIDAAFCLIGDVKGGNNAIIIAEDAIKPAVAVGAMVGVPAGIDPELRDNGGPTKTHALLPGSLAIDAGDPGFSPPPDTDQRGPGFTRVYNGRIDIGAFELQPVAADILKVANVTISKSGTSPDAPFSFNDPDHDESDFDGSGIQLKTVPVGYANRIEIEFTTEATNVDINSLTLTRIKDATLQVLAAAVYQTPSPTTRAWEFSSPFAAGNYIISLTDAITDLAGNQLDGEWVNPLRINTTDDLVSEFPSGNDVPGGAFRFVFTILPGDADQTNWVDGQDLIIFQRNINQPNRDFTEGNFNGDLYVNYLDQQVWSANYGTKLQVMKLADFNGDGIVGAGDFDIWQSNRGIGTTHAEGDADLDGDVDNIDLTIWQAQYSLQLVWVY